ncbi:aspartate/glutamate racemase family protein [Candidatus Gottesmanbacteria bacterium]|nr:aspartate/glutamate racemase family protein [Candidatus Gottesmanbacteria bacterium]
MALPTNMMVKGQRYIPGIVGGVGPLSHTDFEKLLLRLNRSAKADQEHPVYLLANATVTPNRPQAVMEENKGNKIPAQRVEKTLIFFAKLLEKGGADFLIVLCNGAHFWYKRVSEKITIPWISMIEETAQYLKRQYPTLKRVGILASDATLLGKLYHNALSRVGLQPIAPAVGSPLQSKVMNATFYATYAIKATGDSVSPQARDELIQAAHSLQKDGAEAIITGCTEISVALTPQYYFAIPLVDPLTIVAKTTLDLSMGKREIPQIKEV